MLLSSANSIFANSPISTVRILNETLERVTPEFDPLTPYIWVYKGVDEMIYLGKIKDAQNSYEMASRWALATKPPDELLAKRSQETATFLEKNPNSRNARIGAWTNILIGSINEATREIAIQEIKALGGTVKITADGQLLIDFPEKD